MKFSLVFLPFIMHASARTLAAAAVAPAVVTGIGADSGRATYAPSLTQMDYLGVVEEKEVPPKGVDLD